MEQQTDFSLCITDQSLKLIYKDKSYHWNELVQWKINNAGVFTSGEKWLHFVVYLPLVHNGKTLSFQDDESFHSFGNLQIVATFAARTEKLNLHINPWFTLFLISFRQRNTGTWFLVEKHQVSSEIFWE